MALHEIEHPLGKDIDDIFSTLMLGGEDTRKELLCSLPDYVKATYSDPVVLKVGVAVLRFTHWESESQGAIFHAWAIDEDDPHWRVDVNGLPSVVRQRVVVMDLLGRPTELPAGDESYMIDQFRIDVIDQGLVFTPTISKGDIAEPIPGLYAGRSYDTFDSIARMNTAITEIAAVAREITPPES